MEYILVNFLVRMAFLIGEGADKDSDMAALHQHTLKLLGQALALFPHVPVKLSTFLDRLLQVRRRRRRGCCVARVTRACAPGQHARVRCLC